ncbi:hypothetical protein ACTWP6_27955 [Mycobacterium sp. 4D054]|uniref:hypothetical protein n=1 Tax=Mycobacterium sp. 4D054 TaxID=3457440 RepID=UPI003FD2BFCB
MVLSGTDDEVEISVVIDTDTDTGAAPAGLGDAEVVVSGREMWYLIRYPAELTGSIGI